MRAIKVVENFIACKCDLIVGWCDGEPKVPTERFMLLYRLGPEGLIIFDPILSIREAL